MHTGKQTSASMQILNRNVYTVCEVVHDKSFAHRDIYKSILDQNPEFVAQTEIMADKKKLRGFGRMIMK